MLTTELIELYLNMTENMNIYIVINKIEEKEDKIEVLNRLKDSVSRIELELEDNEQVKNKSFIVTAKKLQSISKNIKSYENIGVNCDILKSSEVGKELLKILEEKTLHKEKEKSVVSSISRIEQPTNDNEHDLKRARTEIYQFQSERVKEKVKKAKQGVNIPTSEKKPTQNEPDLEESHLMIKRSQTFDIEEFEFEDSPVSNKKGNNNPSYYPIKTERNMTKKVGFSQSMTMNEQNMGSFEKIKSKKRYLDEDAGNMEKVLEDLEEKEKFEEYESTDLDLESNPQILPVGTYFSSNVEKPIHSFKMNFSSLGQSSKNKLSPSSYSISQEKTILSSENNLILKSKKEIKMEELGEKFSIPNKIEASISESEYSDMFESEGEDEEPKLEIKVEAVVESSNVPKGLKPRQDICKIELYDNKDIKFYSIYDHLIFSGTILQMFKKPENFYEMICEETKKIEDGKEVENNGEKTKQVKKVKFRGQAKPFMKYLSGNK